MAEGKYVLVRMSRTSGYAPYLSLSEVAYTTGLHPELVERFVKMGLIDHIGRNAGGEMLFAMEVVSVVRRIVRLRNHLGVNYAGIGVILDLMARIEDLEGNLRQLERKLFEME
jgi:MerR family transcriptional regulator, heat shock protein HspR